MEMEDYKKYEAEMQEKMFGILDEGLVKLKAYQDANMKDLDLTIPGNDRIPIRYKRVYDAVGRVAETIKAIPVPKTGMEDVYYSAMLALMVPIVTLASDPGKLRSFGLGGARSYLSFLLGSTLEKVAGKDDKPLGPDDALNGKGEEFLAQLEEKYMGKA